MFRSSLKDLLVAMLAALLHAGASMDSSPDLDSLAFKRTALDRSAVEMKPDEAREYARWALPLHAMQATSIAKPFGDRS